MACVECDVDQLTGAHFEAVGQQNADRQSPFRHLGIPALMDGDRLDLRADALHHAFPRPAPGCPRPHLDRHADLRLRDCVPAERS